MLIRRTYDFDEFNMFFLRLLFEVWYHDMFAQVRFSSSGKGLHIRSNMDLSMFQDPNREKWSKLYGFDITFRTKKGKKVDSWLNIGIFLSRYDQLIINWCLRKYSKYGKTKDRNLKKSKSVKYEIKNR